jgi:hypothetical protein
LITVKIKNEGIYKKCKLLFRMTGLVVETLFEILFERLEVVDLQRAYIEGGEAEVKRLIRESLRGDGVVGVEESKVEGSGDDFRKKERKARRVEVRERLDAESFW